MGDSPRFEDNRCSAAMLEKNVFGKKDQKMLSIVKIALYWIIALEEKKCILKTDS